MINYVDEIFRIIAVQNQALCIRVSRGFDVPHIGAQHGYPARESLQRRSCTALIRRRDKQQVQLMIKFRHPLIGIRPSRFDKPNPIIIAVAISNMLI